MRLINNKFLLSDDICKKIISEYKDKVVLAKTDIRQQKIYHELNENSWLWNEIQKLISSNLGDSYSVYSRVTILKYTKGDYFLEHTDGPSNARIRKEKYGGEKLKPHFFGGVELCDDNEFKGGDFYIDGKIVEYKKGRMFTHSFNDLHEVKEVTDGTRWSVHFLIHKENLILI